LPPDTRLKMNPAEAGTDKYEIDTRWLKASVAGSMWAASEIVLGSFLHNLRVPFSGSILTAIGIILLISINYKWNEKGLFWRAGLICALMKTLSPSAVIFGPMIAIISEALLLEFSVRLLGRTFAGYITGAVLAMSWSLIQRVLTLIIFYGRGIIEVYTELADMAERQTGIQADMAWLPILISLSAGVVLGFITALAGIRLGRKTAEEAEIKTAAGNNNTNKRFNDPRQSTGYSITWLFVNLFMIAGAMLILSYSDWIAWSLLVPVVITIWAVRYKRALRQLLKPRFWIFFVLITLITSFVFTRAQTGDDILRQGLTEGLRMNFRAAVIILGFSVTGTELYNPSIRNYFSRSGFRKLPLALELATESLPVFISSIPSLKIIIRRPVPALSGVVALAINRLEEMENKNRKKGKLFIITGAVAEGKTKFARDLSEMLIENNINVDGILTERIMSHDKTSGYDIVDVSNREKTEFLRISPDKEMEKIGRYSILPAGLQAGKKILGSKTDGGIRIIDEIGKLEIGNKGWAESLTGLLNRPDSHIIITVRDSLSEIVINKWGLGYGTVFNIAGTDVKSAYKVVSAAIT